MPKLKEDYTKQEKINGVVYNMSPSANYRHSIVNGNIYGKLREGFKGSLCLTFMENLDYRYHVEENDDYVIPDIMVICDRKHLKGSAYTGVPRFIVETLSPATALNDKTIKKDIYQNAGVSEYWIVSSKERAVEIYYLEDSAYVLKYFYILQDDTEEEGYNADTIITLRDFPHITMALEEIFENVEQMYNKQQFPPQTKYSPLLINKAYLWPRSKG